MINFNDKHEIISALTDIQGTITLARKAEVLSEEWERYSEACSEKERLIFESMKNMPDEFVYDKDFLLSLLRFSGSFYQIVPDELFYDKDLLYAAISEGHFKQYDASGRVRTICGSCSHLLEDAPYDITDDREFMLKCARKDAFVLEHASERLKADKEIADAALKLSAQAFRFISKDLHIDRDIVLDAVKRDGWLIADIPHEYEDDLEILYAALSDNHWAFRSAPKKFRDSEKITADVIRKFDVPLDEINEKLWEKPSFVLEMVKMFGTSALNNVDWSNEGFDLSFAGELLKADISCFNFLPDNIKNSDEIAALKEAGLKEFEKSLNIKQDIETELDSRWDNFIAKLTQEDTVDIDAFKKLFFDTYWYFRKRKDTATLRKGGWHILSCLSALKWMPQYFVPDGCEFNEYNTARCLCEDLLSEINHGMPGFYVPDAFAVERKCTPPAGCSERGVYMTSFEEFENGFESVVSDFDDCFDCYSHEEYHKHYILSGVIRND